MTVAPSDLLLVLPEFNAPDIHQKVGGYHTSIPIGSDVDSLFLPGTIVGSDSSDVVRYQYRKCFVKNLSDSNLYCKVFGYNNKVNNIVRMALEKDQDGLPLVDGSEVIQDYLTAPALWGDYTFTEIHSEAAQVVGNSGVLEPGSAQGIWLRQSVLKNSSEDASDHFMLGLLYSEVN